MYGARAQSYAEIEAGAMGEVLDGAARQLGFTTHIQPLDTGGSFAGMVPIAMSALQSDSASPSATRDAPGPVRTRTYRLEGARVRVATYVDGEAIGDEDAEIAPDECKAFDENDRHVLIELGVTTGTDARWPKRQHTAERLALGGACQRLMTDAVDREVGLCILGYAPASFAGDEDGIVRSYLIGGALDPRQQQIDQGDAHAERELASTILREYVQSELQRTRASITVDGMSGATSGYRDSAAEGGDQSIEPPVDLIDEAVRDIWQDVLRISCISGRANFFRLGGTSIDALTILQRVYDRYFIELKLQDVLAEPTAGAMARILRENTRWSATIHEVHALIDS